MTYARGAVTSKAMSLGVIAPVTVIPVRYTDPNGKFPIKIPNPLELLWRHYFGEDDCPEPAPPPPPPPIDWCGSTGTEWVPDKLIIINIAPACHVHDICYGPKSSTSRFSCDADLGKNVFTLCMAQGGNFTACSASGATYFYGVRLGGSDAYQGGD